VFAETTGYLRARSEPIGRTWRDEYSRRINILFTFRSGSLGHFLPLLPLAREAKEAGHHVAFASGADQSERVVEAGFRFFNAGMTYAQPGPEMRRRYPDWQWGNDFEHVYSLIFAGICGPATAKDLPAVFESFHPDLVVAEVAEFGGPVVAAAASIPWAAVGWGLPVPADIAEAAGQAVAPTWEDRGLNPLPYGGLYQYCYLDPCPPTLSPSDGPAIPRTQPLRPEQLPDPNGAPDWLLKMPDRPTVYVTLGTSASFAAAHGDRMITAVAEGLGGEDLNVIVTGPAADQAGPMPANIAVARFIPLADLLPRCQLVVSHAGSGTILAALAMGLPQILLPMGADQFRNAAAVVGARAGRQIVASVLDAVALRTSVMELLDDTAAASAANTVKNAIAAMPDARSAISVLEQL
jgi:UDP:flavonoid glycosyltransferase YjiC (YdhE family)